MFGLSGGHLLIVAVIVLLFGNRRLPELGSALGRGIHAFKKGLEGKTPQEIAEEEKREQDRLAALKAEQLEKGNDPNRFS
jgi:sec-independent protein translocase protein TatA